MLEILTRLFGEKLACGTMVHAQRNVASRKTPYNRLKPNALSLPSSLIPHPSSLKGICFTLRKTVFRMVKDGLLEGKTLSFATPNIYLSEVKSEK